MSNRRIDDIDTVAINNWLENKQPEDVIRWAKLQFGPGLVMMSSFGIDAALTLSMVTKMIPNIPVIAIDTGYLPTATLQYMETLKALFKLNLKVYRSPMSPEKMTKIHGPELWAQGEDGQRLYQQIRKIEPMKQALRDLQAHAVMSGIRATQTENRSTLPHVVLGMDDIYKIHPALKLTEDEVELYFQLYDLPRHPLAGEYDSIGDTHSSRPGKSRSGRSLSATSECGLHVQ